MSLRLTTLSLLALTLSLSACGDDKNQTDTSNPTSSATEANTDGSDGTDGVSSAPTTGEVEGTNPDGSDSQTSNLPQTTSSATEDSAGSATDSPTATSSDDTTGQVDPQLVERCTAVCGKFVECKLMDSPDCVAECSDGFGDADLVCSNANLALLTCVEGMTCEQLSAFLLDDEPGPCASELDAVDAACQTNACTGSVGSNRDNTECSVSNQCPDEPKQAMSCDTKTCTCTVGDMKTGECPAMNICADLQGLDAKTKECCGF